MTGEMTKPENAELGEEYWRGRRSWWGGSAIGDESLLIRPNYPEFFNLADELAGMGIDGATVRPFDTYQGPYISTPEGRLFHGDRQDSWVLVDRGQGSTATKEFRSRAAVKAWFRRRARKPKGKSALEE